MAEKRREESSFTVTDRRLFTPDGELRSDAPEESAPAMPAASAPKESAPSAPQPAATAESTEDERDMPTPPSSAEQEAQAAAYKQSAKDLDSQVELSGHSVKDFEITFERFLASLYMSAMLQLGATIEEAAAVVPSFAPRLFPSCDGALYVAEKYKAQLPKAKIGKSCVRFKKLADLDRKALEALIKETARSKYGDN